MKTPKFTVVGRDDCPWCKHATDFLSQTPYEYTYFNITDRKHPLRDFIKALGETTVPQIWWGTTHIGGFSDLVDELSHDPLAAHAWDAANQLRLGGASPAAAKQG